MQLDLKYVLLGRLLVLPGKTESRMVANDTFQRLASLAGQWEGKFPDGRAHSVTYRLTANGSALVETWTLGPERESVTIYTTDGIQLIASHYCPQGNQPRLRLVEAQDPETFLFQFLDGANLGVEGKSHQRAFWIRIQGPNSFTRSETYVQNGSSASEIANTPEEAPIVYTRRPGEAERSIMAIREQLALAGRRDGLRAIAKSSP